MKRTFSSLSVQEALHVAIFIEERNASLYHRFAEMFVEFRDLESLEIAGVFWDMAVEENHHSTRLQRLYTERFGNLSCAVTEEDIVDMIEVPRLEDGNVLSADPRDITSARERALQVALAAEQNARKFYASLAEYTPDAKLRRLYQELAEFETDHVEFLERKLTRTAAGNDQKS
ncbi:MAG TPA: ferritin family protein [Terriglobales bacterium]|nr:ferritin family protein [Terriglobales bacterium]